MIPETDENLYAIRKDERSKDGTASRLRYDRRRKIRASVTRNFTRVKLAMDESRLPCQAEVSVVLITKPTKTYTRFVRTSEVRTE